MKLPHQLNRVAQVDVGALLRIGEVEENLAATVGDWRDQLFLNRGQDYWCLYFYSSFVAMRSVPILPAISAFITLIPTAAQKR